MLISAIKAVNGIQNLEGIQRKDNCVGLMAIEVKKYFKQTCKIRITTFQKTVFLSFILVYYYDNTFIKKYTIFSGRR